MPLEGELCRPVRCREGSSSAPLGEELSKVKQVEFALFVEGTRQELPRE